MPQDETPGSDRWITSGLLRRALRPDLGAGVGVEARPKFEVFLTLRPKGPRRAVTRGVPHLNGVPAQPARTTTAVMTHTTTPSQPSVVP